MSDNTHKFDPTVPVGDKPFRPQDLPGFAAFENSLDAGLQRLVQRWADWATFNTDRQASWRALHGNPRKPR